MEAEVLDLSNPTSKMNKDEIFHETEQRIAEGDWTIMAIAGSCTCESCQSCQSLPSHDVPFFYTIGLYAKRLPELILFAHIHPHAAAHVVNAVADRLSEGKITVEDGLRVPDILEGHDLKLRLLGDLWGFTDEDELSHFGFGIKFASNHKELYDPRISAIQVLWPDPKGVFPDEEGYDPQQAQPLLKGARDAKPGWETNPFFPLSLN